MDTVVTVVLSHDTSKVAVGGGEGAHGHKYCHQPIFCNQRKKQTNSEHSKTLLLPPTHTVVELRAAVILWLWLWVGSVCKIERRGEDGGAGPIPDFLFGQEVSTPWSACTAAGQQHGGCSQTRCHTWGDKKQNEPLVVDGSNFVFSLHQLSALHQGLVKVFETLPGNELDKVVVEGDACTSIKDGGMGVTDEVRGHHL